MAHVIIYPQQNEICLKVMEGPCEVARADIRKYTYNCKDERLFCNFNVNEAHQGKGYGSLLLKSLNVLDKSDRPTMLYAKPYKNKRISRDDLIAMYSKYGFVAKETSPNGVRMVYHAQH